MKNRLPKPVSSMSDDKVLMARGRGSCDQLVRGDNKVSVLKWFDNKPIIMASSAHGEEPRDECRRWSKTESEWVRHRLFSSSQHSLYAPAFYPGTFRASTIFVAALHKQIQRKWQDARTLFVICSSANDWRPSIKLNWQDKKNIQTTGKKPGTVEWSVPSFMTKYWK